MTKASGGWSGCHGVRLRPGRLADSLGRAAGPPLVDAEVIEGPVRPPEGDVLWRLQAEIDTPSGTHQVDQRLHRRPEGPYVLQSPLEQRVEIDALTRRITVDGGNDAVRLQLVTTFALPLLLLEAPAIVVHAAACARDGRAVLICGETGRGKSSALVALMDAGWQAVSEDMCVLDLRSTPPTVWPGPPWVRRGHGQSGPAGASVRFETPDKTAWDIGPWQTKGPATVAHIVFLDAPGGEAPEHEPVDHVSAVPMLARHAVWLGDPDESGRRLFGPSVDVSGAVPMSRLRLPFSKSWLDHLLDILVIPDVSPLRRAT